MPLLTCKNISLMSEGRIVASQISFELNAGSILAIIGDNIPAKQALIDALLRFEKPAAGEFVFGKAASDGKFSYLPSPDKGQVFLAKVSNVVLSGCLERHRFSMFYSKKDREDAAESMRKLGITELADRRFSELSGGQRQRVLLAKTLCTRRKLLLLDEPATGLDAVVSRGIYELVRMLSHELLMGIIIKTADTGAVLRYADYILRIDMSGTTLIENK